MNTIQKPQLNVQEQPYLQQIYIETGHWVNDMAFFDDEIRFLQLVLDKYFARLLSNEHVNRVQLLSAQLSQTAIVKNLIRNAVLQHRENLDATLKNSTPNREDFLALEHTRLTGDLAEMAHNFKTIKNEIFTISEAAIKDHNSAQI